MKKINKPAKKVTRIPVTVGQCEDCGYDYGKDHLTIDIKDWAVVCSQCGAYSQNWDTNATYPPNDYDFNKENNKKCPVCGEIIDYHVDGFIHYEEENIWIHREHSVEETEEALNRPLTAMEKAWVNC